MGLQFCCRECAVSLSSAVWLKVPWHGTAVVTQADGDPSPSTALVSLLLSVLLYPLFAVLVWFLFYLTLFYFIIFWILLLPTYPSPSFFCLFFVLIPVIPLDHQPGSHLLQCHYFLSQP